MAIPHITAPQLDQFDRVRHGFFGREGGMSEGIYRGLNCGPFSQDEVGHINENRQRVANTLNARLLVTNKQVHGKRVCRIDRNTDYSVICEADGLITKDTGIAIGALGADCAPVLFADSVSGVVGVAHAGWQGALGGVTDAVIAAMCDAGASLASIVVAIGPAIQKSSYEVGEQFRQKLIAQSPVDAVDCFHHHPQSGKVHFDLPGYIALRLSAAGINNITQLPEDTYGDEERYFSYRRSCHRNELDYGRQVGAICLV